MKNEKLENLINDLQDVLNEEHLYEFASIARGNNSFIAVNPDSSRGWFKEEYFKVYNNDNARKADKVIRIKFRTAQYVYHKNSDGKQDWNLNSKERRQLIDLLNKQSKLPGFNNWQYAIIQFNTEAYMDENPEIFKTLTMEKQQKMDENNPQKYYLPIDLEMPDYTKL